TGRLNDGKKRGGRRKRTSRNERPLPRRPKPRSERDKPHSIGPERNRRDPERISTRHASSWPRKRRRSRVPVASSQLAKRPSRSEKSPSRRWRPTWRRVNGPSPRPRRNGKGGKPPRIGR